MAGKSLNDVFTEIYMDRFVSLGIADRLRCIRCQRVASQITKAVHDTSPVHYDCYCQECREHWIASENVSSPR